MYVCIIVILICIDFACVREYRWYDSKQTKEKRKKELKGKFQ